MPRSSAQAEGPALGPRLQVEGQLMFPELPRNGPKRLVLGLGSGRGARALRGWETWGRSPGSSALER